MADRDEDDDVLAGYDLAAWEAPAPAPGLADAVLARLASNASPTTSAVEPDTLAPRRRRTWLAVALASAVVTAGFVWWGLERAPGHQQGDVVATRPQLVELGASSANLDPGAAVQWRREHDQLRVAQLRGAATWSVGAQDRMVIDAGAMGASVEAHGASLRVEVRMNPLDPRVVGASALTAAAVALVTVSVYDGHVAVSGAGETVDVPAGGTVTIAPGGPPRLSPPGPAPDIEHLRARLDELQAEIDQLRSRTTERTVGDPAKSEPPRATDDAVIPTNVALQRAIEALKPKLRACPTRFAGTAHAHVELDREGRAVVVEVDVADRALARCVSRLISGATFPRSLAPVSFEFPVVFVAAAPAPCDAAKLRAEANAALSDNLDAIALARYEEAIRCESSPDLLRMALMAACRAKDFAKAKSYYQKVPEDRARNILQICIRYGYDPRDPGPVPRSR